jgi:hypothetical protein
MKRSRPQPFLSSDFGGIDPEAADDLAASLNKLSKLVDEAGRALEDTEKTAEQVEQDLARSGVPADGERGRDDKRKTR